MDDSIMIVVQRENALKDSMQQFMTIDDFSLHKEIKILFINEEAQDAGGLIREWFSVLMEQLFAKESGLFEELRSNGKLSYMVNEEARSVYFRFAGMVFGKALFDKVPVDAPLNKILLNALVGT